MKRLLITTLLMLTLLAPEYVFGQFSARTKVELAGMRILSKDVVKRATTRPYFVEVPDESCFETLRAQGIRINSRYGNHATAELTPTQIMTLKAHGSVKRISAAIPMELTNDTARSLTQVDAVHLGTELGRSFIGKGVVIGVIDSGIDFNHINFKDKNGNSRVKRVYMPYDSTGVAPIINGDTLPGSHYITQEQISLLTTDTPNSSHGTHTTGTAAGSCMLNSYYGVAPETDLVLCGMPLLFDSDIANCINYICDYADQVGKPVVISMSFSSQEGAHDGTSQLCRLFDHMSQPGRVFVISAGNSARERIYLEHSFQNTVTDTLRTYIDRYYSTSSYRGYVSGWSSNDVPHRVAVSVIDKNTRKEVASTAMLEMGDTALAFVVDSIPELSPYMTGEMLYATAIEDNGRFHSIVEMNVNPTADNYRIGLKYVGPGVGTFKAWGQGIIMINDVSVPGYKAAVRDHCISDLATSDHVISVGAYCSRAELPRADGTTGAANRSEPYDIAYFSSYGPDANGISRPDVCGPGLALVSSASRYVEDGRQTLAYVEQVEGIDYPYVGMSGTSMSTPFVAGVIALWLQQYPQLTSTDLRDVLSHSSIRDNYVLTGNPERWGYGKIDAMSGLKYLLQSHPSPVIGDVNGDGIVDVADVNEIINIILGIY